MNPDPAFFLDQDPVTDPNPNSDLEKLFEDEVLKSGFKWILFKTKNAKILTFLALGSGIRIYGPD